jgi:outer membrane protein TolC
VSYAFLPTLEGLSQLAYYSNELSSPNRDHVAWTVGGVLRWNIFDGGLRYADKAARQTDVALAEQRVRDVERRARIEVTQALRSIQVAEAGLAVSQRTRDIAAETARLTRIGYLNGTGTSFDLVDSARRLREAEIDFTLKEFEVVRAKIAAFLALATCNV